MGARVLARLGTCAAAEAAAHPACFDAAAAGDSLWVAARSDDHSVTIVHATAQHARGRAASSGSLHARVSLPEPVALAQLGAVHADAEGPGSAVLLLVGASCRLWAFQLRPPAHSSSRTAQPGPPIEVAAADSAAVAVPLAHPACPARHQLAAAVAWEHLAFSWDPATGTQHTSSCGGGGRGSDETRDAWDSTGGQGGVVPLPLDKLAATLQRYRSHGQLQDDQMPLLVHSIASWACQLPAPMPGSSPAAAPAIPADATAAAYVGMSADGSGTLGRLACHARFELPPAACSQDPTSAVGHLLVATSRGQVFAFPVGTPASSGQRPGDQLQAADGGMASLPVAVCIGSSSSSMCILPLQAPDEGSGSTDTATQGCQELVLLAEAGQLVSAAAAGLGSCQACLISTGSGCRGDAVAAVPARSLTGGPCRATVLLTGQQAVAAIGSTLCYLLRPCNASGGSESSMLRCMDLGAQGSLLQASARDVLLAGPEAGAAGQPLLLAAAVTAAAARQPREQLVVLTAQGALLSVSAADLSTGQPAAEVARLLTVQAVESNIQVTALYLLSCFPFSSIPRIDKTFG